MGLVTVPPSPFPPSSGKTGDIAERVTELENDVSTLQSTKAPKTDIAPVFSAETNYSVGDLVYYASALYECTTEHTAGAWNSEHFTATAIDEQLNTINNNVGTLETTKVSKTDIAPAFSAETNYSVGDLVYYNGALYECTTEHTAGAWNSEHFTATAIDDQLNTINSNLTSLDSKITSFSGYVTSGKWYKIGEFRLTSFVWFLRYVIVACNGANIKCFKLRSTPTEGFNNNDNAINQLIGTDQIGGLKYSADYKSISILLKAAATGDIQYSLLSQSGEIRNVVLTEPVETAYTDSDLDVIN